MDFKINLNPEPLHLSSITLAISKINDMNFSTDIQK